MAFSESLLVAMFCLAVVFAVLIILFAIIRAFSYAINVFSKKAEIMEATENTEVPAPAYETYETEEEFSSGTLKLKDVDEETAAMIMAIVSNESGIPLSELIFKSIKQIAVA